MFKEMLLCAQLKSLFQGCSNSNTISFAELDLVSLFGCTQFLVQHRALGDIANLRR